MNLGPLPGQDSIVCSHCSAPVVLTHLCGNAGMGVNPDLSVLVQDLEELWDQL